MSDNLPKTFQMRFDLKNEHDLIIAHFLHKFPWSKTQKVKEILLMYIQGELVPRMSAEKIKNLENFEIDE